MNLRIVGAILKKDVRSLLPLLLLTTALFAGDVILMRVDLVTAWTAVRTPVLLLAGTVLVLAVFQLDPPASLVDDWLCRPVPRAELLIAKLVLVFAALRLSQIVATLVIQPILGSSLPETLQRALLGQDLETVALLPLLMFAALVTRTLVQGVGVLLGMFILAFVIPSPFVSAPGPLQPAIGSALLTLGMGWLAYVPTVIVAFALFGVACWLAYWRRSIRAARVLLGVTMVAVAGLMLLPMWLAPWQAVNAAQRTLAPSLSAVTPDIGSFYLRTLRSCFPATQVRNLADNPEFTEARHSVGVPGWTHEDQAESPPDSVAFLTSVEPRRLPPEWRVGLSYVEAEYFAAGITAPVYALRPTTYHTSGDGLSHAWVLPEHAVRHLSSEAQVELRLRYYLALLEPHHFRLRTDGQRYAIPRLGYCRAQREPAGSHIEVRCFSGLDQPAQISAELEDIPASRVYNPPNYSPGWARWPFGQKVRLAIGSPMLSKSDHITVTAWTLAGYIEESVVSPGILGGDTDTCPLPSPEGKHFQQSVWRDTAKHEPSSISVDQGVQLEVLDFGGQGSPIVLLAGLGATAHSYDELAPRLAQQHRVIAITRRGTGYSSKPNFGYDTPRLAQDVLQVMDALKIEKPLLVGHSIAGEELTWLGGRHPERFRGLVYLDAAYDRSRHDENSRQKRLYQSLPPAPPMPPEAFRNYEAMSRLMTERGHVRLTEGELIAMWNADKPFLAGTPGMDSQTAQAVMAAVEAPDYAAIEIPALAIYAIRDPAKPLPPWYDTRDAGLMETLTEIGRITNKFQRENIDLFRRSVRQGEALEMPNADHYIIQSNQSQVLEAIEAFSRKLQER